MFHQKIRREGLNKNIIFMEFSTEGGGGPYPSMENSMKIINIFVEPSLIYNIVLPVFLESFHI